MEFSHKNCIFFDKNKSCDKKSFDCFAFEFFYMSDCEAHDFDSKFLLSRQTTRQFVDKTFSLAFSSLSLTRQVSFSLFYEYFIWCLQKKVSRWINNSSWLSGDCVVNKNVVMLMKVYFYRSDFSSIERGKFHFYFKWKWHNRLTLWWLYT
jgi:hypothetical protein